MRYCVKRNGEGIIGIYPSFGGALRGIKRYQDEGRMQNPSAARIPFECKGLNRIRTVTIEEDFLYFSWSIRRKEAEKLYKMMV